MKKNHYIFLLSLFISTQIIAQINLSNSITDISYDAPVEYELGGITIQGILNLDKNAIITLSGLNVGKKIMVPGEDFSKAIKKLWEQNLFGDIKINVSKIVGENVFIEIYLTELPKLTKFGFKGASKSEVDKIREKIELARGKVVTENIIKNTQHIITEDRKSVV